MNKKYNMGKGKRKINVNPILFIGCTVLTLRLLLAKYKIWRLRGKVKEQDRQLKLLVDSVETVGKIPDEIIDAVTTEDAQYEEIYY